MKQLLEEARKAVEMAYLLDEEDKIKEAEESAKKALSLYKKAGGCPESIASLYVFLGDFTQAENYYQIALNEVRRSMCSTCYGVGFPMATIQVLERKIEMVREGKAPMYSRVLKKENREEIGLVAFDLDGTLTQAESHIWATLNNQFGSVKEAGELAQRYYSGEIDYHTWASEAFELLMERGANEKNLEEAISPIELVPGGRETILILREAGKKVALISGSLEIIVKKLSLDNLFDQMYINSISFSKEGDIYRFSATYHGDGAYKVGALKAMASKYGLRLKECAYVGNDANDIEIARIAGLAIAFNPRSEEFRELCQVVVEEDIRRILPYLGVKGYGFLNGRDSVSKR